MKQSIYSLPVSFSVKMKYPTMIQGFLIAL